MSFKGLLCDCVAGCMMFVHSIALINTCAWFARPKDGVFSCVEGVLWCSCVWSVRGVVQSPKVVLCSAARHLAVCSNENGQTQSDRRKMIRRVLGEGKPWPIVSLFHKPTAVVVGRPSVTLFLLVLTMKASLAAALWSASALPLLAAASSEHGLFARQDTPSSVAPSSGAPTPAPSAGSSLPSGLPPSSAVASGLSTATFSPSFSLASSNPTAVPLSSITPGDIPVTGTQTYSSYPAGSTPTHLPGAPGLPNSTSFSPCSLNFPHRPLLCPPIQRQALILRSAMRSCDTQPGKLPCAGRHPADGLAGGRSVERGGRALGRAHPGLRAERRGRVPREPGRAD